MSTNKTEKILEQIQHLIAKIEDSGVTEEEREMCRQRADALMFRYAIDEATLAKARGAGVREKPSSSKVVVSKMWDKHRDDLWMILNALCDANRCRVMQIRDREERTIVGHIVGFDADVRFVEMMYVSIHLTFASKIDPKWDSAKTEGQNVRTLKEAGWKWVDIARAGEFDWPDNGLLIRIYKRQCKEDGVATIATQRFSAYRESFAKAFFGHLRSRIWAIERTHKAQVEEYEAETGATGTALVLADRTQEVDEAFYERFPVMRPMTEEERAERRAQWKAEEEAEQRAALTEREEMLRAMTPKQRERFLAKEEREAAEAEAKEEREYLKRLRQQRREDERGYDASGRAAGRAAASAVDLTGGRSGVSGSSSKALGS